MYNNLEISKLERKKQLVDEELHSLKQNYKCFYAKKLLRRKLGRIEDKLEELTTINCEVCNGQINRKYKMDNALYFCSKACLVDYERTFESDNSNSNSDSDSDSDTVLDSDSEMYMKLI
jgi:hypothetical protein